MPLFKKWETISGQTHLLRIKIVLMHEYQPPTNTLQPNQWRLPWRVNWTLNWKSSMGTMGRARQSGRTASNNSDGSSLVLYQDLSRSRLERIRKTFSRKWDPFLCNAVLQKSLCYIRTTPRVSLEERKLFYLF